MSRFFTVASSSKGNCACLAGGGSALIIDAGCSYRQLSGALEEFAGFGDRLEGIVITHEHTDHVKGLKVLLKKLKLPLFASPGTVGALIRSDAIPPGIVITELTGEAQAGGIAIRSFSTPHDAAQSVGLRLSLPDGRSVGVATDLGYVSDAVESSLLGCDFILLESNYDPAMLSSGFYPWHLKRRIAGERGHLSNEDGANFAAKLLKSGTTRFLLGHLSVNNNFPALAFQTAHEALEAAGGREGEDYLLAVAPAYDPLPVITF